MASRTGVSAATSKKERAVVSGGAGFIGSHLCETLLGRGLRVLALDNFITGSRDNVTALAENPDFDFRQANVNERVDVEGDVRYVLHFASPASPPQYDANPIHTLKVGTVGTMNMLGLARAKSATFLLASTSEVYGDPGVDTRIIRIFNTHGPRMQVLDGRAVPNFMAQAIRGEPLTVYGDGSQTRSLCYVSDLVRGVLATLDKGDELPVNLGNPNEVTVLELAQIIIRLAESNSPIELRPLPVDDPKQRRPDIAHARKLLGWEPEVALEDGLALTLEYFRRVV